MVLSCYFLLYFCSWMVINSFDDFFVSPSRFAYIEFADKESVRTAMALDESLFRGRQIKVRDVLFSDFFFFSLCVIKWHSHFTFSTHRSLWQEKWHHCEGKKRQIIVVHFLVTKQKTSLSSCDGAPSLSIVQLGTLAAFIKWSETHKIIPVTTITKQLQKKQCWLNVADADAWEWRWQKPLWSLCQFWVELMGFCSDWLSGYTQVSLF